MREEVHLSGSPLDLYLQEVGGQLAGSCYHLELQPPPAAVEVVSSSSPAARTLWGFASDGHWRLRLPSGLLPSASATALEVAAAFDPAGSGHGRLSAQQAALRWAVSALLLSSAASALGYRWLRRAPRTWPGLGLTAIGAGAASAGASYLVVRLRRRHLLVQAAYRLGASAPAFVDAAALVCAAQAAESPGEPEPLWAAAAAEHPRKLLRRLRGLAAAFCETEDDEDEEDCTCTCSARRGTPMPFELTMEGLLCGLGELEQQLFQRCVRLVSTGADGVALVLLRRMDEVFEEARRRLQELWHATRFPELLAADLQGGAVVAAEAAVADRAQKPAAMAAFRAWCSLSAAVSCLRSTLGSPAECSSKRMSSSLARASAHVDIARQVLAQQRAAEVRQRSEAEAKQRRLSGEPPLQTASVVPGSDAGSLCTCADEENEDQDEEEEALSDEGGEDNEHVEGEEGEDGELFVVVHEALGCAPDRRGDCSPRQRDGGVLGPAEGEAEGDDEVGPPIQWAWSTCVEELQGVLAARAAEAPPLTRPTGSQKPSAWPGRHADSTAASSTLQGTGAGHVPCPVRHQQRAAPSPSNEAVSFVAALGLSLQSRAPASEEVIGDEGCE